MQTRKKAIGNPVRKEYCLVFFMNEAFPGIENKIEMSRLSIRVFPLIDSVYDTGKQIVEFF